MVSIRNIVNAYDSKPPPNLDKIWIYCAVGRKLGMDG